MKLSKYENKINTSIKSSNLMPLEIACIVTSQSIYIIILYTMKYESTRNVLCGSKKNINIYIINKYLVLKIHYNDFCTVLQTGTCWHCRHSPRTGRPDTCQCMGQRTKPAPDGIHTFTYKYLMFTVKLT